MVGKHLWVRIIVSSSSKLLKSNILAGRVMAGRTRMGLPGNQISWTKPSKSRWAVTSQLVEKVQIYSWTKFSLEETLDCLTLWVSHALSWLLLDPSGPTSNYITRPVFLPTTISISIPAHWIISDTGGSIGDESSPRGGGDVASRGPTHPTSSVSKSQKVSKSRWQKPSVSRPDCPL